MGSRKFSLRLSLMHWGENMPEQFERNNIQPSANGKILVAVNTKNAGQIDLHFGHANCFLIYSEFLVAQFPPFA